ncbi:PH domain-containing protein [Rhizobium laguerreae]|nr:PH domain-containing protein [Rhizobium laguerreae]
MKKRNFSNLLSSEYIVHRGGGSVFGTQLGLIFGVSVGALISVVAQQYFVGVLFCLVAALLVLDAYLTARSTSVVLTNKRLFVRSGWLSSLTIERPIANLSEVSCYESLTGSLFSFGTLLICVRDGHDIIVGGVRNASSLAYHLDEAIRARI